MNGEFLIPMNKAYRLSWIVKTGQKWKLWVIYIMGIMSLLSLIFMIICINYANNPFLIEIGITRLHGRTLFLVNILVFLLCLFLLIRCPSCKKRPIWQIVNNRGLSDWIHIILTFAKCPICGYRPKTAKQSGAREQTEEQMGSE